MNWPNLEIYSELRTLARHFMSRERKDHTLSATDLIHEAFTRLSPLLSEGRGRSESLPALFAISMRRILIDHARKRSRRMERISQIGSSEVDLDMLASRSWENEQVNQALKLLHLDEALTRFSVHYPKHAELVEMRFFGGMSVAECSENLGICRVTTQRYWNFSRAWIHREIARIELE